MPIEPHPGLRPFKPVDHGLFFGQERNLDELFQRLARNHFIAVLGESGCGKSSLVRAGLIPMLLPAHEGAIKSWRVVIAQPGMDPIGNLAESLQGLTKSSSSLALESTLRQDPM